jgi:RND superfamily putative drug exporter
MRWLQSWGRFVFRHRASLLPLSLAVLVASVWALGVPHQFTEPDNVPTQAARADTLLEAQLSHGPSTTDVLLVFSSERLSTGDPAFAGAMETALAPLSGRFHIVRVVTPFNTPSAAKLLVATDHHSAIADVVIQDTVDNATDYYPSLRAAVRSSVLSIEGTGAVPLNYDYNHLLNQGLATSGSVALPLVLVLLLLIFGTVIAAALPLVIGVLTILGASGMAVLISQVTAVSPSTTEFVSFLGLGLAIDYSLFVVSRFREALGRGRSVEDALVVTMATAGRAILVSGLTVMAGLSGLLFFRGTWLGELAYPLICLVALALIFGTTLLPASLAFLGRRIDAWRIPLPRRRGSGGGGFWHWLATWVMRRPWAVLIPSLALVAVAASPLLSIQLGTDHGGSLPPTAESRQGSDAILASFPGLTQATIPVVVQFGAGAPLSAAHVGDMYDLAAAIARVPGVVGDTSPFTTPGLDRAQTIQLLTQPGATWPASLGALVSQSVGRDIAVLEVQTSQPDESQGARDVVTAIRELAPTVDGRMLVTGSTAYDMDRTAWIVGQAPWAIGAVIAITFVILLLLLGSVILPLKAVLTNLLSISVAFGAMVWTFQQGHLAGLFGTTPLVIDPTVPVAMFCIVFGLSMDYEVFLLTRIQEERARTGSDRLAVAGGLERCGRLVSYAALIMVAVVGSFALGDVAVIKMVGLGTATAIAVDATIMRGLLVPALMVLLGRGNWWMPAWLAWVVERIGLSEVAMTRRGPGSQPHPERVAVPG